MIVFIKLATHDSPRQSDRLVDAGPSKFFQGSVFGGYDFLDSTLLLRRRGLFRFRHNTLLVGLCIPSGLIQQFADFVPCFAESELMFFQQSTRFFVAPLRFLEQGCNPFFAGVECGANGPPGEFSQDRKEEKENHQGHNREVGID